MITGIIIALDSELSSLTKKKINKGDCQFINDSTLVALAGAGSKNATQACQLLIDNGAQRLISWGCAAALKPSLHPGDLVIPDTLLTENKVALSISNPWLYHVIDKLSFLNPYTGTLAESNLIIAKSSEKKIIYKKSRAIALDMETISIAKVAQQNNLPVLVIRTIADPVTMDLPNAVNYALNNQGDIEMTKLLGYLLTHPAELPGLIKLGFHFNAASNKLKLVAKHLDIIAGFEQKTGSK